MNPVLRKVRGLAALALTAGLLPLVTATAATPSPYPGLPEGVGAQWAGAAQRGYGVSGRAQQAFWIRANVAAADVETRSIQTGLPPGVRVRVEATVRAYFVSPPGSEQNYGDLQPVVVRTLAFGAIPVQVSVHISQMRRDDGTPEPITLTTAQDVSTGAGAADTRYTLRGAEASVQVGVRLSDLTVDGVPVDLGSGCRTADPAELTLSGRGYENVSIAENAAAVTTKEGLQTYYNAAAGGRLEGNVDLPAFAGCGVGEDLSPLLTSAISGPDNPLLLQLTGPDCIGPQLPPVGAPAPGTGDDISQCFGPSGTENPVYQAMDDLQLPRRD